MTSQATVTNNVGGSMCSNKCLDSLPPGFRFKPTDEELIVHYLRIKILERRLPPNRIREVNLYEFNPKQLFETYKRGEDELYFFTQREKRHANGTRPNRNTGDGRWKASGGDKPIYSKDQVVGYKKSLVFFEKNASDGSQWKTNWLMQEYKAKVQNTPNRASIGKKFDDLVLCKIYQTREKHKNSPQQDNGEEEPDETVANPALQPHFRQDSMLLLRQSGVDNMFNDAALPHGVVDLDYNMAEETVPNAAHLQPHFNQSSMHHEVVDYNVSSYAYSGADMNFGPDFIMGEREHVKLCDYEAEDWIDRAQLINTITYGESSDVMLDSLWSED